MGGILKSSFSVQLTCARWHNNRFESDGLPFCAPGQAAAQAGRQPRQLRVHDALARSLKALAGLWVVVRWCVVAVVQVHVGAKGYGSLTAFPPYGDFPVVIISLVGSVWRAGQG